ncbi:MAG: hypothetical protein KatS3mg111_4331 [Pirellulaceae bacterium]|nr:MAG: hypothetical protein KatS3mg111_4331 [Pirellulaceae bacterium]
MAMERSINVITGRHIDRRTVLRGAGVALSLPWLSAMQRPLAAASQRPPRRFVAVTLSLGLYAPNWIPKQAGKSYQPPMYLQALEDLRERLTVVSGSSHPEVTGGHRAEASILTANPVGSEGRARNTISLDQLLAKHLGDETRFSSLVLGIDGTNSPSYTENGSMIPAESSPSRLFAKLFVDDSPRERELQRRRILEGRSIMDLVAEDARALQRHLGAADRQRLDAYFSSVRELEVRMTKAERWAQMPKPRVDVPPPRDIEDRNDLIARQKTMHDVIRLALKTDSCRFITLHTGGGAGVLPIEGVREGYHTLSHHGMDETKLQQLAKVETAMVAQWGAFLRDLAQTEEQDGTLLDNTMVLLTSNLGNASNHSNKNMPVLFAGGPLRHAGHLAFDQRDNYPLPNLFVTILQACGLPFDKFMTSTGTMTGIDIVG